jgi:hypothetical protein
VYYIKTPILPPTRDEIPLKWGKIPPSGTRERGKNTPRGRRGKEKNIIILFFLFSVHKKYSPEKIFSRKIFSRKYFLL